MSIELSETTFSFPGTPHLLKALRNTYHNCEYILGEYARAYENNFSTFFGTAHACAIDSKLKTFQDILEIVSIDKKRKVVCSALLDSRYVLTLIEMGFSPTFIDLNEHTLSPGINDIVKQLDDQTLMLILDHRYGQCADIDRIKTACQQNQSYLFEIVSAGFGSKWKNRLLGTFGDFSLVDFHPQQLIRHTQAAMFTTDNSDIMVELNLRMRSHAQKKSPHPRLSEFYGLLGLHYLDQFPNTLKNRQKNRAVLIEKLKHFSDIEILKDNQHALSHNVFQPIRVLNEKRSQMLSFLQRESISAFLPPLPGPLNSLIEVKLRPPLLSKVKHVYENFILAGIDSSDAYPFEHLASSVD